MQNDGSKSFHKKWLTKVEVHEYILINIMHITSVSIWCETNNLWDLTMVMLINEIILCYVSSVNMNFLC